MSAVEIPGLAPERAQLLTGVAIGNFIYLGYRTPFDYEGSDQDDDEDNDDENNNDDDEDDEDKDKDGREEGDELEEEEDAANPIDKSQATTNTAAAPMNSDALALATDETTETQDKDIESNPTKEEDTLMSDAPAQKDEEHDEYDNESEAKPENVNHNGLYYVADIVNGSGGQTTKVIDVKLVKLAYESSTSNIDLDHTFRVFGNDLSYTPTNGGCQHVDCANIVLFSDVITNNGCQDPFILNPGLHFVKEQLVGYECPAECDEGFLSTETVLADHLPVSIFSSPAAHLPHVVPCPCCMGTAITIEWENTYAMRSLVDIGNIVELIGRLNPIRSRLGLAFHQFDERMWGYGEFHDMLEDDNDLNGNNANSGFDYYDDAMDTQAAPIAYSPASAEVIATLPRKSFDGTQDEECLVCQDSLQQGQQVVELKCGHTFCDTGCIEMWLKQSDTCPGCRAKVT